MSIFFYSDVHVEIRRINQKPQRTGKKKSEGETNDKTCFSWEEEVRSHEKEAGEADKIQRVGQCLLLDETKPGQGKRKKENREELTDTWLHL